ncbi:DUF4331 family protein [Actinacidiphila soli]|uniref:DUF4331 family protein n=1 Tax=Actinacidiphila soli TaxID=2487275 RepID=UPI0013E3D790|nr:DUF4331 family protein [Actinacidiphila soli]
MSDHLSSLRAVQDPVIDLTDLYFFPVPDVPGRLAVVLNLFPGAQPGAAFSDAVLYRMRLAPADIGPDAVVRARGEDAVAFDLTFTDIDPDVGDQGGVLSYGTDRTVTFRTGENGVVRGSEVTVFAGLRRDPFFMDVKSEVRTRATRRLAFTAPGVDAVAGQNVLSIVLELDADAVLGTDRSALWAATGESLSRGTPAARFERIGRPEAKNVLLSVNGNDTVNATVDLRDLYNLDDPFDVPPASMAAYRARLDANLAMFDQLDDAIAWPFSDGQHHPLTETLLHDHLVLDTTKPSGEHGYLDVERGALTGQAHKTCGGRWLNEDVIDILYSVIVGGWHGRPVHDGVDAAVIPATRTFPYLAEANPNPPALEAGAILDPSD